MRLFVIVPGFLFFVGLAFGCSPAGQKNSVPRDFVYPEAQGIVEIEQIQTTLCLCGVVQDAQGDELEAVLVEILDRDTRQRAVATFSDAKGRFQLDGKEMGETFCVLRFSKPGFNTVLMRVRLDPKAHRELTVRLPFSA